MITIDDFKKLEIKIGEIVQAEKVEGADKLLKLEVDFGEEKRQIVSGIAEFFEPENLVGKQVPVLCNLQKREIRGIESQGMILAVIDSNTPVLLHPHKPVELGSVIR